MNERKTCVTLLSASVAALLSIGAVAQQPAPKPSPSTPVTITGPLPVPVTGSATVSGSVAVTNTPLPVTGTVGLTSGSSVSIANTAANPVLIRDVDGTKEPFQTRLSGAAANSAGVNSDPISVPAGKVLVIEHVSVAANVGAITSGLLVAIGYDTGGLLFDYIPCVPARTNALNHVYACAAQTRMYVTGQPVHISVSTIDATDISFGAFVSGYYVNAP
jgi:hypothetical protein